MYTLRTGVFVLFVLLVPVSSKGIFFTEPVICYYLDGILILYCIFATVLFFREKFHIPSEAKVAEDGGIYQELERINDPDTYQTLEPSKAKKKSGKKKKPKSTKAEEKDKDPFESLVPNGSDPPPQSPH
ncbi:T-cell surface glycoprotein CD3 zeta chain [Perca flavescens]|uniref:T-cell surface glycoprotein CD3 zeta chain n=1 Tax=Perca flavescens TaxID=8167 RepID=UPI00106E994A|nr:T-cell surface glycoprotein CD3 zeta chain [Perca flavescens]